MGKDIVDNKTGVPLEHYKKCFREMDPLEAAKRSNLDFKDGVFRIKLLGRDTIIEHPELLVKDLETGSELAPNASILLARLILEGKVTQQGDSFYAYNEMPWGELYHANFKGRCILRLAYGFGRNLELFKRACEALGGISASVGDVSYDIKFVEDLTVRLIFWEGDEEFPPSAQILFSDNFPFAWGAEDMAVVGDILIDALKKA